jgi:hypothetical protein
MHEYILLTVPRDKPIPLGIAEPLHLTVCHSLPSY